MKKAITVQTHRTETQNVEVEFPIYRYHDVAPDLGHPDEHFQRIDHDGKVYSIHRRDTDGYDHDDDNGGVVYELETGTEGLGGSSMAYALGQGEYELSEQKFYEMLARARAFLDRFPPKTRS